MLSPGSLARNAAAFLPVLALILVSACCPVPPPSGGGGDGSGALLLSATANVSDPSLVRFGMLARENQPADKEWSVPFALPRDGVLTHLFVAPTTALETTGAVVEITVVVNSTDTPLHVVHTSTGGSAVLSDTSTEVPVHAGDLVWVRFAETAGLDPVVTPGSFAVYNVTFELR